VLPDAVLLHLAECPPADEEALIVALRQAPAPSAAACAYPGALLAAAAPVSAALADAAAGQRPWTHPEVLALARGAGRGAAPSPQRKADAAEARERLARRLSSKAPVYQNCRMLSEGGELLCFCDRKRLEWCARRAAWAARRRCASVISMPCCYKVPPPPRIRRRYVTKGLAVLVQEEPFTVRLTFAHRDDDSQRGSAAFYTSSRANRCVACGEGGHYLRWRVVPACYRRALPVALKSHRSHDVVLLCMGCHERAQTVSQSLENACDPRESPRRGRHLSAPLPAARRERNSLFALPQAAARMKAQLAADYGVPLSPPPPAKPSISGDAERGGASTAADEHPFNVRRAAVALQHSAPRIPQPRLGQLRALVRSHVARHEPEVAAQAGSTAGDLTEGELWAGLLAGLGGPSRRRTLRRWAAEGRALPAALAEEASGAAAPRAPPPAAEEGGAACASGGASELRGAAGHEWHGREVVAAAQRRGGEEELSELCARFRRCFVDALAPRFLPEGWEVTHNAPRAFGDRSVYRLNPDRPDQGSLLHAGPRGDAPSALACD
jgi:cation-transporting P-type ATPase D